MEEIEETRILLEHNPQAKKEAEAIRERMVATLRELLAAPGFPPDSVSFVEGQIRLIEGEELAIALVHSRNLVSDLLS